MNDSRLVSKATNMEFTFLTNHAHVILQIARDPNMRMRQIAIEIGITERAVQRIVEELTTSGYLLVTKDGRRNHYEINPAMPLRHPLEAHCTVGEFVRLALPPC